MYSKATIAGHPIHPMLIAYPVAGYTGTLVGFAVYAANGQQFWLRLAIALNIAGVGMALLAALPGLIDWAFGVPSGSAAKTVGLAHAGLNVTALCLFGASLGYYATDWDATAVSPNLGLGLSSAGILCTLAAGFLGWMLVQTYHIGVELSPAQRSDEAAIQQTQRQPHLHRHVA
jgi:uncharacterized membrane protein